MSEKRIQPCLCGNQDPALIFTVLNGWQIYCSDCGAETEGDVDRNDAIEWWNCTNRKDEFCDE